MNASRRATPELPAVGVDTGGTFTDFVAFEAGTVRTHKVLSQPAAPERAILEGLQALGLADRPCRLIHGSTVATNAVLERRGARTALVTDRGFADLLTIGRQARPRLYDLTPTPGPPPVPRRLCLEVDARTLADGRIERPLDPAALRQLAARVRRLSPEAVAVVLLHAYRNPHTELRVGAALSGLAFTSLSHEVLPAVGEYERGVATWLNAYVGPLMAGYLSRLEALLPRARVSVMQSSAQVCGVARAARQPVRLLLSGPAAGLSGALHMARLAGEERIITCDMGGTSTDVALLDGDIGVTRQGRIGVLPVAVPMVDMHTIGAGGGSVAGVDPGGALRVGPRSAGADPGPACYGRGGTLPTVTDANVVLGRLPVAARLAGAMPLDAGAATAALARLGQALGGLAATEAAAGVVRLVNEHMARALRVISVGRGHDPRRFTLCAFGGAGGLHACELAELVGMRRALVPPAPGVLSAWGMLVTPPGRHLVRAVARRLGACGARDIERWFRELMDEAEAGLAADGVTGGRLERRRLLELCYEGQAATMEVPWEGDPGRAAECLHRLHEQRFGHRLPGPVMLASIAVRVGAPAATLAPPAPAASGAARPQARVPVAGVGERVPCWRRSDLSPGQRIPGPAIVLEPVATSFVAPGWEAAVVTGGALLLTRHAR